MFRKTGCFSAGGAFFEFIASKKKRWFPAAGDAGRKFKKDRELMVKDMYQKTVLENGVRIVTEKLPHMRSASLGIWVKNGSRYETPEFYGMSHFIEHMLFKGTETMSALDIAKKMDEIGGHINAFTTKECTCYHVKTLGCHLRPAAAVLADMFLHSRFGEGEVQLERGVIFEEIDMYEDSPEDLATEKIAENCYAGTGLGHPILGDRDSLSAFASASFFSYFNAHYRPEDTVVALAGNFTPEDVFYISGLFSEMRGTGRNDITPAVYRPVSRVYEKSIEQNHICIGFEGVPAFSEERFAAALLGNMIGGGMSSRLFQKVREERGLCYSVYTFHAAAQDTGMFNVYTALNKASEEEALRLIREELERFRKEGPSDRELERTRQQVETNILLAGESTHSHMNRLGKTELFEGRHFTDDYYIAQYDKVTKEGIMAAADRILDFSRVSVCAVGNVEEASRYLELLG